MATFAGGKIEAYVGPAELGAGDQLEVKIVEFINKANHSLFIAVQELDNEHIAQAIIDASWRGVTVRMYMEQSYLQRDGLPSATPKASETEAEARRRVQWTQETSERGTGPNRKILAALLRNSIDVKADFNPKIFHQKFIIRDSQKSRKDHVKNKPRHQAVLTGSTNFTKTGTHKNLNHVVVFNDTRIVKEFVHEFEEIRQGTFGKLNQRHENMPKTINLNDVPVRILFAPDDAPELEIVKQMLKCESRLNFAIFTFAGSSGIDDAMIMLKAAGRDVKGVLDPGQGRQSWAATDWLHDKGVEVRFPRRVPGFGKLHHKLMVIDDAIVVGGSMNYTAPANDFNDENIFVIGSPYDLPESKGGPVDHEECKKIADFFREEIERISSQSEPFVP